MALHDLLDKPIKLITVNLINDGNEFTATVREIETVGIWVDSPGLRVALVQESGMAPEFGKKEGLVFLPFSQMKAIIS